MDNAYDAHCWERCILHLDMDAFYAAVEMRDNPSLRGKPVIIGALPHERGVVSTCSYEARQYGIHSAMSIKEAYRLCPHGIYMHGHFDKYHQASSQVHRIMADYTDQIEFVALDEGYLDITASLALFGGAARIGQDIKRRVWEETKLTCSIGIGYNMMAAKLASEEKKPDGFFVIPDAATLESLILDRPVSVIWGVGKKTALLLQHHGIHTVRDVKAWDEESLRQTFGQLGADLYRLSRGIDPRSVVKDEPAKSFGKEMTFQHDLTERTEMQNILKVIARSLSIHLQKQGLWCYTITLKIKFSTMQLCTRSQTLPIPTHDASDLYDISCQLLNKIDTSRPIRLIGLSLSNPTGEYQQQLTLEQSSAQSDKRENLNRSLLHLYDKYGTNIVKTAGEMEAEKELPE